MADCDVGKGQLRSVSCSMMGHIRLCDSMCPTYFTLMRSSLLLLLRRILHRRMMLSRARRSSSCRSMSSVWQMMSSQFRTDESEAELRAFRVRC